MGVLPTPYPHILLISSYYIHRSMYSEERRYTGNEMGEIMRKKMRRG
jgi:hypothetical protein